ncbi:MAG: N-acetyl-gamma-glutamyl-phosphate reductase [Alphaproteobacteria bacterium]|nr:N-acetyl-gamma-glutamyl-phosphate reductase [Alphaproteobacteria bacterium]MBU0886235.1 N-acetyl-gamma-glutamyl-phosphate reductase [Alphaproteobacteria bacterium]MBU1815080.1 N-acetyl-gamma-glutamyl-phosphate reductase [Alphaproteobacteria bacterium]MBU2089135.1 N-acetyl-gamma-glutamyl-phosphate reductase [Alphaproteobacteria bacterium]
MTASSNNIRVGILGASGYTGAELIRLLAQHPFTRISLLTGDRAAGKPIGDVFPHLGYLDLPVLTKIEDAKVDECDVIFCALPHGTTQEVIAGLPNHLKVVDLSADFRLHNLDTYAEWYGHAHQAPELQKEAVYGITELAREAVKKARLVANPGCYPTAAQLPLVPLVEAGQIDVDDIIIDAKSGVSGAGRAAKEGSLFTEVSEGIHAYGVASHRHAPEIEQGLTGAAGREIRVNFTPHLMPMNRGILSTAYVRLANGASAADLRETLAKRYAGEPFVRVLPLGQVPATRHVRGSNHTLIGVVADRLSGRAIIISVIDNLVKGASGQAVQNMNAMTGLPETTALSQPPMFP